MHKPSVLATREKADKLFGLSVRRDHLREINSRIQRLLIFCEEEVPLARVRSHGLPNLHLSAQAGNLLLQPARLGLGDIALCRRLD